MCCKAKGTISWGPAAGSSLCPHRELVSNGDTQTGLSPFLLCSLYLQFLCVLHICKGRHRVQIPCVLWEAEGWKLSKAALLRLLSLVLGPARSWTRCSGTHLTRSLCHEAPSSRKQTRFLLPFWKAVPGPHCSGVHKPSPGPPLSQVQAWLLLCVRTLGWGAVGLRGSAEPWGHVEQ